jgi:hypothetical protein
VALEVTVDSRGGLVFRLPPCLEAWTNDIKTVVAPRLQAIPDFSRWIQHVVGQTDDSDTEEDEMHPDAFSFSIPQRITPTVSQGTGADMNVSFRDVDLQMTKKRRRESPFLMGRGQCFSPTKGIQMQRENRVLPDQVLRVVPGDEETKSAHNAAPRAASRPMVSIRISDDEMVKSWLKAKFDEIQQNVCKHLAKTWIKVVEPRKQTIHPYKDGKETAPGWWPEEVRHKEPDHLDKKGKQHELHMTVYKRLTNSS